MPAGMGMMYREDKFSLNFAYNLTASVEDLVLKLRTLFCTLLYIPYSSDCDVIVEREGSV
jgi:hypothetical protein